MMSQQVVCESLNINAILNARSGTETLNEVCVLSICGGKNDIFTKTVVEWLQKTRNLSAINLLLCGANKNVDPLLAKMPKSEPTEEIESSIVTRKKKKTAVESSPKLYLKHQNNLPTVAQWKVLQPDIVVIGLHCLSERWCAKNSPNESLFPITEKGAEESDERNIDNSEESDSSQEEVGNKRKRHIPDVEGMCVEQSRRPTLFRTEIYRRMMLLHCLELVAKHRPKIVFIQNITEPSKQGERRRKEEVLWSFMIEILYCFGVECAYRVRSMGLELKEEQHDDYPTNDVWCNGVFLERIDNEPRQSTLYQSMSTQESIQEATKWIFYDRSKSSDTKLDDVFHMEKTFYFADAQESTMRESSKSGRSKRRKRSVTLPVKCCFPSNFAKALAHFAVAQVVDQ